MGLLATKICLTLNYLLPRERVIFTVNGIIREHTDHEEDPATHSPRTTVKGLGCIRHRHALRTAGAGL